MLSVCISDSLKTELEVNERLAEDFPEVHFFKLYSENAKKTRGGKENF